MVFNQFIDLAFEAFSEFLKLEKSVDVVIYVMEKIHPPCGGLGT
jgi:hypothetical protein